ncbi:nicotinamide riboside kinase 1-like [Saccoglossus kowalevskii]|uniref:Nicotinamide riboside kinase 1-like n=1 Tax=Saccoglossus kowalevskii TaxID=10224 RepID=A0ABM0M2A2_SACKO|nr:PREDICTED: nicotinamide riboside kinase 1-like [Saccoglossus kowalevskii]
MERVFSKTLVIGISGVSNGGKTTLATRLAKQIPNAYHLNQDTFFKLEKDILIDKKTGHQRYDDLSAFHLDEMTNAIKQWLDNPSKFVKKENPSLPYVLIFEGILIFNYRPLLTLLSFDLKYFLTLPFEEAKRRRSMRIYEPKDPDGMFDNYVWPMYLKNKLEIEEDIKLQELERLVLSRELPYPQNFDELR